MEIKRISNANMDKIVKYNLINGDGASGLKDAAGSVLDVADYVIFKSYDLAKEEKTVLSLVTVDGEYSQLIPQRVSMLLNVSAKHLITRSRLLNFTPGNQRRGVNS